MKKKQTQKKEQKTNPLCMYKIPKAPVRRGKTKERL